MVSAVTFDDYAKIAVERALTLEEIKDLGRLAEESLAVPTTTREFNGVEQPFHPVVLFWMAVAGEARQSSFASANLKAAHHAIGPAILTAIKRWDVEQRAK